MDHIPFINAFLNSDWATVATIAGASPPEAPPTPYYRAIADVSLIPGRGQSDPAVWVALNHPPPDPELFQLMLGIGVQMATRASRLGEVRRLLRLMENQSPVITSPYLKAYRFVAESEYHWQLGDSNNQQFYLAQALSMDIPRQSHFWLRLKIRRARVAAGNNDLDTTEADLNDIDTLGETTGDDLSVYWAARANLLFRTFRTENGLACLDRITSPSPALKPSILLLRLALLCQKYDWPAVRELLRDPENDPILIPHRREYCMSIIALSRGDPEEAILHARRSITLLKNPIPVQIQMSLHMMLHAELSLRNTTAARHILATMDLEGKIPYLAMERVRLLTQEGDLNAAAIEFQKVLNVRHPGHLRGELQDVPDLSAFQVETLRDLAAALPRSPDKSRAETAARTPPAPPPAILIGESREMKNVRDLIARLAPLPDTVLITGETGTGKDLAARILHESGPRAGKPFLAVNCASLADSLLESELFGHTKGAFTGAVSENEGLFIAAGEGTLFLDEMESMPPRLQAVLLRTLENGDVRPVGSVAVRKSRARVVAATNRPLEELIREGKFRKDLYYRLTRLEIGLPPLRERTEDIPLMARHVLERLNRGTSAPPPCLGDDLIEELKRHDWPGNVRELINTVERIVALSGGRMVLGAELFQSPSAGESSPPRAESPRARATRERRERLGELFREHRKLTRHEIIRLMKCGNDTVAADLSSLEKKGIIRRVRTEAGKRTAFFVIE
ncbi:MAG: sigma 54-interacting transcriptional regulator [Planctomycetota bacterium]